MRRVLSVLSIVAALSFCGLLTGCTSEGDGDDGGGDAEATTPASQSEDG